MSDWWGMGSTAAQDEYENIPKITVRPPWYPREFGDPQSGEEAALAEYVRAITPAPRQAPPDPIRPSVYDTQGFMLRPPRAPPPTPVRPGERRPAEVRSYEPTLRERAAQRLMGDEPSQTRRSIITRLMGTSGLGESGIGLADAVPFLGSALGGQEEAAKGNYGMAAVNLIPGAKIARSTGRGLTGALGEAIEGAVSSERRLGGVADQGAYPAPTGNLNPLKNEDVTFRGMEPKDFSPQDWKDFGEHYGVPNMGPLSPTQDVPRSRRQGDPHPRRHRGSVDLRGSAVHEGEPDQRVPGRPRAAQARCS